MRFLVAAMCLAGCRYNFAELDAGTQGDGRERDGGAQDALGDGVLAPRLVFITLIGPNGAMGGLSGADTMCTNEANTGGHTGSFRAVLGAVGSDPKSRIMLGQGREIRLPDNTPVATDATFFSTPHLAPINLAIDGSVVTGVTYSWTNFTPDGTSLTADCQGWTVGSGGSSGGRGLINFTDASWANADTTGCNFTNHLICIEQ